MRWVIDVSEVQVGPQGILVDGQMAVAGPLAPAGLASALGGLKLAAGRAVRVGVDDAWCRTLWLAVPPGVATREEKQGLLAHQFREIFAMEIAPGACCIAARRSAPWSLPVLRRGDAPFLAASLPPALGAAIVNWARQARLRLLGLGSCWGNALTGLPASSQGALAVWQGQRMTVGAWSARCWLGWRSFIAHDQAAAELGVSQWLRGLTWTQGELTVWCQGWAASGHAPPGWTLRPLPGQHLRPPAFDFRPRRSLGGTRPLRQKLIAGAALATLVASILVSLPDEAPLDASAIVPAREPRAVLNADPGQAVANPAEPEPAESLLEESIIWPKILGVLEDRGQRRVLYSVSGEAASVLAGGVIAGRFRVEQANADRVVLFDLRQLTRQEILLGWQGSRP